MRSNIKKTQDTPANGEFHLRVLAAEGAA